LYFGHLGALHEIIHRIQLEEFEDNQPRIIATGGFASLFDETELFDKVVQDLVLRGLLAVLKLNESGQPARQGSG
jgi:type III pantothenate kinase